MLISCQQETLDGIHSVAYSYASLRSLRSLFAATHAFGNCKNLHNLSLTQIQCNKSTKKEPSFVDLLCIENIENYIENFKTQKYVSLERFKTLR